MTFFNAKYTPISESKSRTKRIYALSNKLETFPTRYLFKIANKNGTKLKMAFSFGIFMFSYYIYAFLSHSQKSQVYALPLNQNSIHNDAPPSTPKLQSESHLEESESTTYDLHTLLNVDAYIHGSTTIPKSNVKQLAAQFPNTIFSTYAKSKLCPKSRMKPTIETLRNTFSTYEILEHSKSDKMLSQEDSTLTVEVSGTLSKLNTQYINEVLSQARFFKSVLLISTSPEEHKPVIARLRAGLSIIKDVQINLRQGGKNIDTDTALLANSKHVFAHSPVVALAHVGESIFASSEGLGEYLRNNEFKWTLKDGGKPIRGGIEAEEKILSDSQKQLKAMGKVEGSCCDFQGYGYKDGKKIVCSNALNLNRIDDKTCWIMSIGSQNKWSFERDVYSKMKNCNIHVFDCTGDFEVPQEMKDRVKLHKLCVGPGDSIGGTMHKTLKELLVQYGLGVPPAIAKMDVEGWEIPSLRVLLRDIHQDNGLRKMLPGQLLVEMHSTSGTMFRGIDNKQRRIGAKYEKTESFVQEFFQNLTNDAVGYRLVHRADNPYCLTCSEVTLVLGKHLPSLS